MTTQIFKARTANLSITDNVFLATGNVDRGREVIEDVAIVQEGEAKGHGFQLDADFVRDVVRQGNEAGSKGIKARFGHPTMSATSLGTFLGRFKNFREDTIDGKALARADLFLSRAAKDTPSGNRYDYVLTLAEDDAKAFGNFLSQLFAKFVHR